MSVSAKDVSPQPNRSPTNMAASYLLEGLNELGMDYMFCNLGTDHAPIIEALAQWEEEGKSHIKIILCPHENVAMHMAQGYTRATGKGQAVLVHVDAGTTNAAMGMHNAAKSRLPLLLMAGTAPYTIHGELLGTRDTTVHFIQDAWDMKGIVRNYTKWEYQLPSGVVVKEALRRAHSVMESDPKGPVFMTLPREVLAETWEPEKIVPFDAERYGPVAAAGVDEAIIDELATRLLAAKFPLAVTSYAGRNEKFPALIAELGELTGMGVVDAFGPTVNIDLRSPCFMGYQADNIIGEVDFGMIIDSDTPWMPRDAKENPDTFWAHIDIDTIKRDIPMWGYPTNLRVEADSFKVISRLLEVVKERMTDMHRQKAAARLAKIAGGRGEAEKFVVQQRADKGTVGLINPGYVCAELNKVMGEDDILVSEAVMNELSVIMQLPRFKPGTKFGLGGGGLGFGGGAALGVKLANPDKMVMHLSGDGSFYFGNMSAVYSVSQEHNLPIFTVVFENGGWSAVKACTQKVHPDGVSDKNNKFQALLNPKYEFEKVCEAAGGHGENIANPDDVPAAIQRCVEAVKSGRSACLTVHVTRL